MNQHRSASKEKEAVFMRLYVAGGAPHSLQAQANLEAIFEAYAPPDGCRLEVVDVLEEPLRALEDDVFVTPTLVQLSPHPARIIGALDEQEKVARLLGLLREQE